MTRSGVADGERADGRRGETDGAGGETDGVGGEAEKKQGISGKIPTYPL